MHLEKHTAYYYSKFIVVLLAGSLLQHAVGQQDLPRPWASATSEAPLQAATASSSRHLLQTTPKCKDRRIAAKGCFACNVQTRRCSQCKPGYVMQFKNVNCLQQVCCNMVPTAPPLLTVRVPIGKAPKPVDVDLMEKVQDERIDRLTLTVAKFDAKWGSGALVKMGGKLTGVWRFSPAAAGIAPGSSLTVSYTVTDMFGAKAQGKITLKFFVNTPPRIDRKRYQLRTLTAGVTAVYPVRDLLASLKASDKDGDALSIPKMDLRTKGLGDKLTYKQQTKTWEYYCDATQKCAKYRDNELVATVTDGISTITGVLLQPVKPRPALVVNNPVQLQGSETLDAIYALGPQTLEDRGFVLIPVSMPADLVAGDGLTDDVIPVNIPQEDPEAEPLVDGIEFYGDRDGVSYAELEELPVGVADKDAFQLLFGIMSSYVGGIPRPHGNASAAAAWQAVRQANAAGSTMRTSSSGQAGSGLSGLTSSSNQAGSDLSGLTSSSTQAGSDLSGLTSSSNQTGSDLSGLTNSSTQAGSDLSDLTNSSNQAVSNLSDLTNSSDEAGSDISGLTSSSDEAGSGISGLTSSSDEAGSGISGLTSSSDQAASGISGLTSSSDQAASDLSGLTSSGNQASSDLSGLTNALVRPQAGSCSGCMIDETGDCLNNPNDPFGSNCDVTCQLDDNLGECVLPGSNTAACVGCIINDYGECLPGGEGECAASCSPDETTGAECVDIGGGGGGGGGGDTTGLIGWLVPPVRTTAMGFWVTLGCNAPGSISVEWDVANDEDFDGQDSDKDMFDDDREADPRRDFGVAPATVNQPPATSAAPFANAPRKLLSFASSNSRRVLQQQQQQQQRKLLQDTPPERLFNGKGSSKCYTDERGKMMGMAQPAVSLHAAASSSSSSSSGGTSSSNRGLKAFTTVGSGSSSNSSSGQLVTQQVTAEVFTTGSTTTITSSSRQLLARIESERQADYCNYYAKQVSAQEANFDCTLDSSQRIGVWFAAWIENSSGYIRQVRVQSSVSADVADPSMYFGSIYLSQTQPWVADDPLILQGG